MDNHFLSFYVKNFKGFRELNLPDLGLFNLIIGDNNVGKTSLLEALLFTPESDFEILRQRWAYTLQGIKKMGIIEGSPIAYYINRNVEDWENGLTMQFGVKYKPDVEQHQQAEKMYLYSECNHYDYFIDYDRNQNGKVKTEARFLFQHPREYKPRELSFHTHKSFSSIDIPYIYFHLGYEDDLMRKYAPFQFNDKKRNSFIHHLKTIIPDIDNLEPSAIIDGGKLALIIRQKDYATLPLAVFGEGTIKLFRLLMELIQWSDQRLMIDEIDSGIHHSRLAGFLQTVLSSAFEQKTQIFATTHSLECLQKLEEVLEKPENEYLRKEIRIIRLADTSTKGVQAYTYLYEDFKNAIILENEIR